MRPETEGESPRPDTIAASSAGDELPPPPAPPGAAVFDELDYQILNFIGRGAYGEVHLARARDGNYCAIKVVYRVSFEEERPYEREYEGILKFEPISRLSDSQLQILRVARRDHSGFFYYIMEAADDIVSGRDIKPDSYQPRTLKSEMQQRGGRISAQDCCRIGLALSTALENLHKHRLVHRDVKPANIIFVNGRPKLADLGLVTDADQTMSCVGTEGYIPPEGPGSPQADIYALGMVLYEAFSGFKRRDFPRLPENLEDLSDHGMMLGLNRIITKACQANPKKRYESARQMRVAFESLAQRRTADGTSPPRRKSALVAIAALVVLIAIIFSFLKFGRSSPSTTASESSPDVAVASAAASAPESSAESTADDRPPVTTFLSIGSVSRSAGGQGNLVRDVRRLVPAPDGNLYGVSMPGQGVAIYKLTTGGEFSTLTTFPGYEDSLEGLTVNPLDGALYGLTVGNKRNGHFGALFKTTFSGEVTKITEASAGDLRPQGMIFNPEDNYFYGVTYKGGEGNFGSIVQMSADGKTRRLASFTKDNGENPWPGLLLELGEDHRLYGATVRGGQHNAGTIFAVSTNGELQAVHHLNGRDGRWPVAGLVRHKSGDFYGPAQNGGNENNGTLYRVTRTGEFQLLAAFKGYDGTMPGCLWPATDGNIYGTTIRGGIFGYGTIFRLTPEGAMTSIFSFNGTNGSRPVNLIQGQDGNLYGLTQNGGDGFSGDLKSGKGTYFRVQLAATRQR